MTRTLTAFALTLSTTIAIAAVDPFAPPRVKRGLPYAPLPIVSCRDTMRGMAYVDTDARPPVLCICAGDLPSYCRADTGTCYTATDCVPTP